MNSYEKVRRGRFARARGAKRGSCSLVTGGGLPRSDIHMLRTALKVAIKARETIECQGFPRRRSAVGVWIRKERAEIPNRRRRRFAEGPIPRGPYFPSATKRWERARTSPLPSFTSGQTPSHLPADLNFPHCCVG